VRNIVSCQHEKKKVFGLLRGKKGLVSPTQCRRKEGNDISIRVDKWAVALVERI